jgi:hypothetical protein
MMPTTFTPVEPLRMSIWEIAQKIAKEKAQAAELHLTFSFIETLTPTCKNPLCQESHHQYPNDY